MERVLTVTAMDNYRLAIEFSTGEKRVFDMTPYLDRGVFVRLKAQAQFEMAFVAHGTVCWPDGLDIAPETLYDRSMNC